MADHLTIYNAHNGESVALAKPVRYHTLQSFKDFLLESFTKYTIGTHENIFLLTSFGMKLNYLMINEMTDIYVFDKRLFSASRDPALVLRYLLNSEDDSYMLLSPTAFSVPPENPPNVKSISLVLRNYETWVNARLVGASRIEELIERVIRHINAIFKSLSVVFQFAASFISGMQKSFDGYFAYVKTLNQKSLHTSWESHFEQLRRFSPLKFKLDATKVLNIVDFLDPSALRDAAAFVAEFLPRVVELFNQFSSSVNEINKDKLKVDSTIEELRKDSISSFKSCESSRSSLTTELGSLGRQVRAELETTTSSNTLNLKEIYTRQMSAASDIQSYSTSLFELLTSLCAFKKKLVNQSLQIFETIASLQMRTVNLKNEMKLLLTPAEKDNSGEEKSKSHDDALGESINHDTIEKIREAGDLLSLTIDLPLLIGFLLIEKRRQFEWHDFFSRGVVSNVSEQLTVLVEHEKAFQKLWLKKFGMFLRLLTPGRPFRVQLPSIDVTLVNGNLSTREDSATQIVGDVKVEREDITNFIALAKSDLPVNGSHFAKLLEKNFKDLVASTDSLKRVTQVVSSLGSLSPEHLEIITRSQVLKGDGRKLGNVFEDVDLNLIRGLRSRISKLEGLLHQQQYNNISNWPVVRSSERTHSSAKDSLLVEERPRTPQPSAIGDPTSLLNRTSNSRRTSSSNTSAKALDASTTIDKHIDNIRLRKEVNELKLSQLSTIQENESLRKALEDMQEQLQEKDFQMRQMQHDYEEKLAVSESVIKDLGNRHAEELRVLAADKNSELKQILQNRLDEEARKFDAVSNENQTLREKLEKLEAESSRKAKEDDEYKSRFENLKEEMTDLQEIKLELLSNMHAKEAEYATERSQLEAEIKNLNEKIEEKTEDYENLMEVTQTKHSKLEEIIGQLNHVVESLFSIIIELSGKVFEDFKEFCYVLESMGLLLVKDTDSNTGKAEYKIRRVKGLRSKKGNDDEVEESHIMTDKKLHSSVVSEVESLLDWQEKIRHTRLSSRHDAPSESADEVKSNGDAEKEEVDAVTLIEIFSNTFEDREGKGSHYHAFFKILLFKEDVQLQLQDVGNGIVNEKFFLNGIFKRFKDVEGFAKKLSKDNKAKQQEVTKLLRSLASKISVNNFQVGDLVLFLPTRVDRADGKTNTITPWTAFNIEAPNYFLDNTEASEQSKREWIVSRIGTITTHEVTPENVNDSVRNPFMLNIGVIWYMIQAE